MRMMMWAALGLALWLLAVGCQGESTGSSDPSESRIGEDTRLIETGGKTIEVGGTPEAPPLQCGPQVNNPPFDIRPHGRFLAWTPEGSHVLFDDGSRVMIVNVEGTRLETIVDANPGNRFRDGFHVDLSPDGSRIVYSSCEFRIDGLDTYETDWFPVRGKYNYEIATVALDGSAPKRLTETRAIDHYPVWSPDMTHIAFLFGDNSSYLRVMPADGSHQWDLARSVASPPLWSPDGEHVAFFGLGDPPDVDTYGWPDNRFFWTLNIVRSDGSGLSRISEHTGAADWSPDGKRLAVVRVAGEDVILSTIAPDGSDSRRLIKITDRETSFADVLVPGRFGRLALGPVSWSPDGTHILYVCEVGVCVVNLDGNLIGQSPADLIPEEGRPFAAWSPDGSRIAVRAPGQPYNYSAHGDINPHAEGAAAVFTMARDGTDVQVLVRGGPPGGPTLVLAEGDGSTGSP